MKSLETRLNNLISERSKAVILVFVVLTVFFLAGATQISTDSGTSQFTEDIPSQEALESINEEFSTRTLSESSAGSTIIIHQRRNALSKASLLEIARFEERISDQEDLRAESFNSIASSVAESLDRSAQTPEDRVEALEKATPSEIKTATRDTIKNRGLGNLVSDDYNNNSVSATGTISTIQHSSRVGTSGSSSGGPGVGQDPPLQDIQLEIQGIAGESYDSIIVFGTGIQSAELGSVSQDSLSIVIPVAITLIVIFLTVAYRDPFDIGLALVSLIMNVIWTFGFMGIAGIPFTQILVSVPPLLLAVGIDFGIHSINRYREEIDDYEPREAMKRSNSQLIIAFAIVAGSTTIGFGSNVFSPLGPIREFGIVAAIGIIFTFVIFGVFLPALKLETDSLRSKYSIPEFSSKPLGEDESTLGKALVVSAYISERIPKTFVVLLIIISLIMGGYGAGISSQFSNDLFLPPENLPAYVDFFPVEIDEYQTPSTTNLIEEEFSSYGQSSVILYISDNLRRGSSLQSIERLNDDPPDSIVQNDREGDMQSILSLIEQSKRNPEFAQLVEENDVNNDGIPDQNLDRVYNELEEINPQTDRFITDSRGSTRVLLTVKEDAGNVEVKQAGESIASESRLDITPTGEAVILRDVSSFIIESTVNSLVIALVLTTIYLCAIYRRTDGRAAYGIINMVPVFVTVSAILATMRYLNIPLNPITATTLSITIGIGVDYTIHMMHRITDEVDDGSDVEDAIRESVKGTGGALFGSMATTAFGIGSLTLAITPLLGQFGLIIATGIIYSFIFSILMLPSLFVIYYQLIN